MEKPLVSTIITTYNWNKKRLSECLDSILSQTYKNIEIIIVNDASTNDIDDTIKEYQFKNKNITYLKNKKNLWCSKSSNKWINYSKWKYIARIDDDDIRWNKDKIYKQVKFLEENPDYAICWTKMITMDENWNLIKEIPLKTTDKEIRKNILISNQFIHSWVLLNKKHLQQLWWYNILYKSAIDYELWCRLWRKHKFANLDNTYTYYRINTQWITSKKWKEQTYNTIKIMIKNCLYYPNFHKGLFKEFLLLVPQNIKGKIRIINNKITAQKNV